MTRQSSCDEAVMGEQADMIRFSCWRKDIPTYHTYHIPLLTFGLLSHSCIQGDVFFPFFFVRFFLGPVKVFKLLAFPGRILIYAVVGDGSLHSFLDTFLRSPFFPFFYFIISLLVECMSLVLVVRVGRGNFPFFSVFFSVVVIVRLGYGIFYSMGD